MDKLLTIIIPAYNMEHYLEKTLESCVINDQKIRTLYEVIVVNDGSTDKTQGIAQRYVDKYSVSETFKLLNKENGGYGSAINAGMDIAKGKYLKILDGDDWYRTGDLEKLILLLDKIDVDMILTDYTVVDEYAGKNSEKKCVLKENVKMCINDSNVLSQDLTMYGICYRSKLYKTNGIQLTEHCYYTDAEYELYPMPFVQTIIYYPLNIYQYRQGRAGQSVSIEGIKKHIIDQERVINNVDRYFDDISHELKLEIVEKKIADIYQFYINSILLLGGDHENKKKLKNFIEKVKKYYPQRYKYMMSKKMLILERTDYLLYKLYSVWFRRRGYK